MVCWWSWLVLACKSQCHAPLPSFVLSHCQHCHWPWWTYLWHRNQQMWKLDLGFPGGPVVGLNTSTAEDTGSVLAWGTKILHATWQGQKTEISFVFFSPRGLIVKHLPAHHCLLGSLTSDVSWPQCKEGLAGFMSGLHAFASTVLLLMNPSYSSLVWLPISYEKALEVQSCLTLCHAVDCSLLGSSAQGIFQARILEWVAVPSPGGLPDPRIEPASLMTGIAGPGLYH